MNQYTFNEIIEKINEKLTESDDDTITFIYNQLFEIPINYIGDDIWEEEINDTETVIEDDTYDYDELEEKKYQPMKQKNNKHKFFDPDDYNDNIDF